MLSYILLNKFALIFFLFCFWIKSLPSINCVYQTLLSQVIFIIIFMTDRNEESCVEQENVSDEPPSLGHPGIWHTQSRLVIQYLSLYCSILTLKSRAWKNCVRDAHHTVTVLKSVSVQTLLSIYIQWKMKWKLKIRYFTDILKREAITHWQYSLFRPLTLYLLGEPWAVITTSGLLRFSCCYGCMPKDLVQLGVSTPPQ